MESNMFCYQCQETAVATAAPGWGSAENKPEVAALRTCWSTSPKGCPP